MNGPAFASHEQPVSVTVKDFLIQAWIDGAGAPDDHVWTIELAGTQYVGPPVDAARHVSSHEVKEMLRQWAREHPTLFV